MQNAEGIINNLSALLNPNNTADGHLYYIFVVHTST